MKCLVIVTILFLISCGRDKNVQEDIEWSTERSTDFNKNLAVEEEIQIKLFLEQHRDWTMTRTGTGLQYYIFEKGSGDTARVGQVAQVELIVSLLDGKQVYKTEKDELDEFVIDRSEIESGIHEGIKKLKVGDHAKMILPSHLAHGLIGDFDKIPPLSVLVVDIKLIALKS